MNKEEIEQKIIQEYSQELLDCVKDITGSVNDIIRQIHNILEPKYLEKLGAECYYTTFACTLKTAFCDFFLVAMKNKSSKDRTAFLDFLLEDTREYIFKRLKNKPTPETTSHPSE